MKSNIHLLLVLLIAAMQAAAQGPDNEMLAEDRSSAPYHYIRITGKMNVRIVQADVPGVTVEGSRYQVYNTVTMLRNDTLFVYQTNIRRQEPKTFVSISVDNISFLEVKGESKVDCTGLINTDFLTIRAYDGAQIRLDVRALKVDSKATGCSSIDLSGIAASNTETIDGCGMIDSHLLDVMDHRKKIVDACYGC
jgi:hypothetical protein